MSPATRINRADDVGGLPISYTFTNGVPTLDDAVRQPEQRGAPEARPVAVCAGPVDAAAGLTLNLGLRFDWLRSRVAAINNPANALFAAYSSPAVDNVPNWHDLNPRIGAAYDLFGNGKTAIKGGINRYVAGASTTVARRSGRRPTSARPATGPTPTATSSPIAISRTPRSRICAPPAATSAEPYNNPSVGTFTQQHERRRPRLHRWLGQARVQLAGDGHR